MNLYCLSFEMTEEHAREVKELRLSGCSWRRLADEFAERYPDLDVLPGNQLEGMSLVRKAGEMLGENGIEW